jgi:hypothetical protein
MMVYHPCLPAMVAILFIVLARWNHTLMNVVVSVRIIGVKFILV